MRQLDRESASSTQLRSILRRLDRQSAQYGRRLLRAAQEGQHGRAQIDRRVAKTGSAGSLQLLRAAVAPGDADRWYAVALGCEHIELAVADHDCSLPAHAVLSDHVCDQVCLVVIGAIE